MEEQKTNKEVKVEEPTPNADETSKSETENQFDKANQVVGELKAQLDRKEKLVEREEKLAVQRQLAGKGQAGTPTPPPAISKEQQESNARIKEVGDATGANWAKKMEEEKKKI